MKINLQILTAFFISAVIALAGPVSSVSAGNMSALEQLDFANGLFRRGYYDMAITEYSKFISLYPKESGRDQAYFGIAESYFFEKKYPSAVMNYRKVRELFHRSDKNMISLVRIGQAFYNAGRYDSAVKYFSMVDEAPLNNIFKELFHYYYGKAFLGKGDKAGAQTEFGKAASVSDNTEYKAHAFLELGDMSSESGALEKAIEYYEKGFITAPDSSIKCVSLYKKATAQFNAGDYNNAAVSFKEVYERFPKDTIASGALCNMIMSLFNAGAYEKLVSEYEKNKDAIVSDRVYFDAGYTTVLAYSELGRQVEALGLLDKLLAVPNLTQDESHKGGLKKLELLIKAKKLGEAGSLSDSLLASGAKDADYILLLKAESLYGLGDYQGAVSLYERMPADYPKSKFLDNAVYGMAYAKKALGDNSTASDLFLKYFLEGKDEAKRREALYNAILIDIKLGSIDKAVSESKQFLASFKDGELGEKVMFRLGMLYTENKRYDGAIDTFRKFVNIYQNSPRLEEAYFELGFNLQAVKNFDEALVYYEKISPERDRSLAFAALKNKGAVYLDKKDNANAAKVFDKIISEFPENDLDMDIYLWLAQYYDESEKPSDALRILDKAGSRKGADVHAKEIAYFKAEAFRVMKDFNKAIALYDTVLSDNTTDIYVGAAHIGKGLCYVEQRALATADAEFSQAIEKNPEDNTVTMRARFELARVQELKGKQDEALKLYMLIAILYTDDRYCSESLVRAGTIFENLGRFQEARSAYQEILDKYPKSKTYGHAQERLKAINGK